MEQAEIVIRIKEAGDTFARFCMSVDHETFYQQPEEKWSIAQHVQHLIISTRSTRLAYILPPFLLRLMSGQPNRPSRSYEELVNRYQTKLQQGGKAAGRYIPAIIPPSTRQEKLTRGFSNMMIQLATTIDMKWKDHKLDCYLAPHPLLGRITLRELGYFTIYHTYHHLEIIRHRVSNTV